MSQDRPNLELWPVGNCQISGWINDAGGLVWGCVPRVDGDPVFCRLLNGDNGHDGVWRFALEGQVSASQSYRRNTPILVTRLEAREGSAVEITDFCPHCTQSGLLSEDMDFNTGELWGNFPQTYSLVGVINCAALLSKSWSTVR